MGKIIPRLNFFNLSLRSKHMLMVLAVSVCSMLAIAYLSYQSGESNLRDRIYSQLTSLRSVRTAQITTYFENLRNQVQSLSDNFSFVEAMKEFKAAFRQLDGATTPPDLEAKLKEYYQKEFLPRLAKTEEGAPVLEQYLPEAPAARYLESRYIAANPNPVGKKHLLDDAGDGSEYSKIHARYHPIFKRIQQRFGFYDIFLIDPETGSVVYTVFKEADFATNLFIGSYRRTNLAEAVVDTIRAGAKNYTKIVDFQFYRPSYGAPAAFIAAPIFDQAQLIGILVLQIPIDEIDRIMTANKNWRSEGLGKTGKTNLFGSDYLMRNVSRFFVEEREKFLKTLQSNNVSDSTLKKIQEYNTTILLVQVNSEAVKEALAGKQGTKIARDARGVEVLSAYGPLQIKGLEWAIVAEMDLDEAYAPIYNFRTVVLVWGVLVVLVTTLVAMQLSSNFVKPINTLIANARKISRGDVEAVEKVETNDEFSELAESFNRMVSSLQEQTALMEQKNRQSDRLLLGVFGPLIAKRLKNREQNIGDRIPNVTILFSDITGFAQLYRAMTIEEVASVLNDIVDRFDEAAEKYGLDRIKTIGDNYIAGCGISSPKLDTVKRSVDMALEMRNIVHRVNREKGFNLDVSIAINSGEVIVGVVGRRKFSYDAWGATVSIANSMLMSDLIVPGMILVSQNVRDSVQDIYSFEQVGYLEGANHAKLAVLQLKSKIGRDTV